MRVAIDSAGRMVVPERLREELGITGPTEVEVTVSDGRVELAAADIPAHVEMRDGLALIVPETPVSPMSVEEVREAIERGRR